MKEEKNVNPSFLALTAILATGLLLIGGCAGTAPIPVQGETYANRSLVGHMSEDFAASR